MGYRQEKTKTTNERRRESGHSQYVHKVSFYPSHRAVCVGATDWEFSNLTAFPGIHAGDQIRGVEGKVAFERYRHRYWQTRVGILISLLMVESTTLLVMRSRISLVTLIALCFAGGATWGLLVYSFNRLFFYRARVLHTAWVGMREAMEGIRYLDRLECKSGIFDVMEIRGLEQYLERKGWRHVWTALGIGASGGLLLASSGVGLNIPVALWAGEVVLFVTAGGGTILRAYTRLRHRVFIRRVEQFQSMCKEPCSAV